jgi:hypothetical protein
MIWSLTATAFNFPREFVEEIAKQEWYKLDTNVVRTEKNE